MSGRPKPFHQFLKLFLLCRRKLLANLLPDILQHLVELRRDIGPNLVIAFLAVGDDFGNRDALFRREMKRLVETLHKLLAEHFRRMRSGQILRERLVKVVIIHLGVRIPFAWRKLNLFGMWRLRIIDQQAAGQRARAKNNHYRQNDFPGIHCARSLWSTDASSVFSKFWERSSARVEATG